MILLLLGFFMGSFKQQGFSPERFMNIRGYKTTKFDSSNVSFVGNWPFGSCYTAAIDTIRNLAFVGSGGGVYIANISNPTAPVKISEKIHTRGTVLDLFYTPINKRLYIGDEIGGVEIWDVGDTLNPLKLAECSNLENAHGIRVVDSFAFVADKNGLEIINVKDMGNIFTVGVYNDTSGAVSEFTIRDTLCYIADVDAGLKIVNISNPANPKEVGSYDTPGYACGVTVVDTLAYIGDLNSLRVIDVKDPTNPQEVGYYHKTFSFEYGIAITGHYGYIMSINSSWINIVDISDPTSIQDVKDYEAGAWILNEIRIIDTLAYISDGDGEMRIFNISDPVNPVEIGCYDTPGYASDITVSGSYAYIADRSSGFYIVDISNNLNPYEVGYDSIFRLPNNVFKSDTLIYMTTGNLSIINVSDPANPKEIKYYNTPGGANGIFVLDTFAYVSDGDSGIRIINVSNPSSPFEVGHYDTSGTANSIWVIDTIAYAGFSDTFRILDVKDPTNPVLIGDIGISCNDLWIDGTDAYLLNNDSLTIIDISKPESLTIVGILDTTFTTGKSISKTDNYIYVGEMWNGRLHVIDVKDPTNPQEVGYYDTPGYGYGVYSSGEYIYVADFDKGLQIYKNLLYGIDEKQTPKPTQNIFNIFPNIVRNRFTITFSTKENRYVNISLYDISGRKVKNLYSGNIGIGRHNLPVSINKLPCGIYFIRAEADGNTIASRKIIKIR